MTFLSCLIGTRWPSGWNRPSRTSGSPWTPRTKWSVHSRNTCELCVNNQIDFCYYHFSMSYKEWTFFFCALIMILSPYQLLPANKNWEIRVMTESSFVSHFLVQWWRLLQTHARLWSTYIHEQLVCRIKTGLDMYCPFSCLTKSFALTNVKLSIMYL